MKRVLLLAVGAVLMVTLAGCKSDPACLFADDYIGCLVITNDSDTEVE